MGEEARQILIGEEKSQTIAHKDSALQRLDVSFNKHIELLEYKKCNLLAYWIKDFSEYHDNEKNFNPASLKKFKRGDIVQANLGFNVGSEFGGLHYCVVVNNTDNYHSNTLNIVPLSSAKENKIYNKKTCVDLGDELYNLLLKKFDVGMKELSSVILNPNGINSLDPVELKKISQKLELLKKLQSGLEKMKHGSIAYIHQITTISKQRIFKNPVLSGIRLSPNSLDLIDEKIINIFTKQFK